MTGTTGDPRAGYLLVLCTPGRPTRHPRGRSLEVLGRHTPRREGIFDRTRPISRRPPTPCRSWNGPDSTATNVDGNLEPTDRPVLRPPGDRAVPKGPWGGRREGTPESPGPWVRL